MQFDGWSLTRARIKTNSYEFCVLVYYYITLLHILHTSIHTIYTPIIPLASYNYPGKIQKRREHCVYFIYYLFVLLGYKWVRMVNKYLDRKCGEIAQEIIFV